VRYAGRLVLITLLESFATICSERGIYFYAHDILDFSNASNLWMALAFGIIYVTGALSSHGLSRRFGEKKLLSAAIAGQVLMHSFLAAWSSQPAFLVAAFAALGLLNGLKWPLIESFVTAGSTPRQAAKAVGRFNVSWAIVVPLAIAAAGPMIGFWSPALFAVPALMNLISIMLTRPLPPTPVHLPPDHPERPPAEKIRHLSALLASSRWLMLSSYALLFLLAPLMPAVFARLGFPVEWGAGLSGAIDIVRVGAFIALGYWTGWHSRVSPLLVSLVIMPGGFFMVLFGDTLALVLAGELLFGLAAGQTYYASLYYAMVVKNASVDAGGAHESLIGSGFALGPALGLVAIALSGPMGGILPGTIVAVGPLIVICSAMAMSALLRYKRTAGLP